MAPALASPPEMTTHAQGTTEEAQKTHGDAPPAARAAGVELIGEYDGSGYKEPPLIARRSDGQVVQLSELLYRVLEQVDGSRTDDQIAEEVSRSTGREVNGDNVRFLLDEKIRPLGVLKNPDGSDPNVERQNSFLALNFKTALVPDRIVRGLTTVFRPLFWPPVLLALLAAFFAFDYWLFISHGIGDGLHQVMYQPVLLLVVFGLLVVATAFHEIGHATACRYGGAEPGKIGFGIYLVWPAFYTDVTDAYRLGRWGRIRVDLGGVYFNAVFILIEAALYVYTGYEPLLIAIAVQHLEMLHQFLPFLRLDGYFVVSDLVGVPDLFQRMKPLLKSLWPWTKTDESVKQLKPKVRFAVTAWVLIVVPILLFQLTMIVLHAPRIFGTGWDSLGQQYGKVSRGLDAGAYTTVAASGVQMLALALPMLGIAYMLVRLVKQSSVAAWKNSRGRPALRSAYMATGVAVLAFVGWVWMPNGDYTPIRRGERWTLQTGLASFRSVGTGNAGLTPADPEARDDPFGAEPTPSARPATDPTASFDEDDRTDDSDGLSDPDPETENDPIFDTSPSPDGLPDETPAASTATPAAETAPPPTAEPAASAAPVP